MNLERNITVPSLFCNSGCDFKEDRVLSQNTWRQGDTLCLSTGLGFTATSVNFEHFINWVFSRLYRL